MSKKIKVFFANDYIAILSADQKEEIVGWHEDEWVQDSQVVFDIANAIRIGLTKGDKYLRDLIKKPA